MILVPLALFSWERVLYWVYAASPRGSDSPGAYDYR